ncbi:hypothetical protein BB559_003545 [Furculomyces boomerangus]|uniref:Uncharacterized protein n=2 Tax=Harpellales TaxID=61421 RepID=A0A2T9YKQ9_9FUNG|nr:hypothetical protein BB559_007044 [Furculomyces boomerangus]PVU85680.1 hypothetical protein BB559_006876 [Furculomyces boomerangus]PVU92915.1 hypothetical protein BB559_003545 [Furculomyces boomerangus]PVZ98012.1 hypothetical protein BB558_005986 [Smittium angustum]PVZ99189.1 hypothetical protein BB558_004796 [Smittium angustum]
MNCVASINLPNQNNQPQYVQNVLGTGFGIAASTSANSINLFDYQTLSLVSEIGRHNGPISDIKLKNNNLVSCGLDNLIKVWDLRTNTSSPVQEFMAPYPLLSFDITCDQQHIIAGSEQYTRNNIPKFTFGDLTSNADSDVAIFFWDARVSNKQITMFPESHNNDITQIKCHPSKPRQFMSASTDGLVCLYDYLNTMDENDAMVYSCNTNVSVQQAGYFGPNSEFLYSISDMNTLSLWYEDSTMISDLGSICNEDQSKGTIIDYAISTAYDTNSSNLYLNAGDIEGNIYLYNVNVDGLHPIQSLTGGHTDIVRCINWDFAGHKAISGGEDGRICFWSAN